MFTFCATYQLTVVWSNPDYDHYAPTSGFRYNTARDLVKAMVSQGGRCNHCARLRQVLTGLSGVIEVSSR